MIEIYKKIPQESRQKKQFSMPLSLEIISECSDYGLTHWDKLHFADLLSIIISMRIKKARQYLEQEYRAKLQKRGINSIRKATEKDFDNL